MKLVINAVLFMHILGRLIMIIRVLCVISENRKLISHQLCRDSEKDLCICAVVDCVPHDVKPQVTATVLMLLRATYLVQLVVHTV